jgi:holdfast attachment protein HfaA
MSEATSVRPQPLRLSAHSVAVALAAALFACASAASAQNLNGSSSQFNSGYGGSGGSQFNRGVDVSTRDENNNQIYINGRMDAPAGSVFSNSTGTSRAYSSGVGGGGLATAIGNNLNVIVQGSWNRVVVDSTQINNGDVTAQTGLNGSLDLQ